MRPKIALLLVALAALGSLTAVRADSAVRAEPGPPDTRTGDVIVRFRHGTSLTEVASALSASDTDAVKTTTLADHALLAPQPGQTVDGAIAALEADPDVSYAEPDHRVTIDVVPNDPNYGSQWHYPKIGLPAAWDITTGSASVIVAVVDTGVELTDPELDGKITSGANAGYDFVNADTDPFDDHGHGTHVAGTVAAETNNATGVAGVCWACKIMPVKVMDHTGNGSTLDVAAGIDWARTHGAKVVNLSLGSDFDSATLEAAVNDAWSAGVIVVAASGNYAGDADTSDDFVLYPAAYTNAIAVGATNSSDVVASFSNYGPELDVTAPGVGIYSTLLGGGYAAWSGTSMATPHVAGVVGLMASAGITDPATIKNRLTSTATDLGAAGFDNYYGHGRINAHLAMDTTLPSVSITAPAALATVSGASVTFSANASDVNGITKVRFLVDGGTLVDDTSAPYTTNWNTTGYANGSHTLQAQATDGAGNVASHSITVTVNNGESTPPTITITSPASGATVSGNVSITANASDSSGIQKVRFWAGSTYLGFDTTAPYSKAWDTTLGVNGPYSIKAQAVDNYDNTASQQFSVTVVNPDSTPPSVSIAAPAGGATVGGTVTIDVNASDSQGLQKVQFWADSTYLGFDTTAPYSKAWDSTTVLDGSHTLKARAIDYANNTAETTITVAVENDNAPPSVAISSPLDGATVAGSVTISATASDTYGIQKVRFWVDGVYLSFDLTAPYSKVWDTTTFADGGHTLKVEAIDNNGNSAIHTIVVQVENDTTPPTVNISAPASGATVSGSAVSFEAAANDSAGIQKVRFWVDSVYLSFDLTAPYSKVWDTTAFANGAHTLKVEAIDNNGNSTITTITVNVLN